MQSDLILRRTYRLNHSFGKLFHLSLPLYERVHHSFQTLGPDGLSRREIIVRGQSYGWPLPEY